MMNGFIKKFSLIILIHLMNCTMLLYRDPRHCSFSHYFIGVSPLLGLVDGYLVESWGYFFGLSESASSE